MNVHAEMDAPDCRNRLDDMAQSVLSTPVDRPGGPLKVPSLAPYADEVQPEGVLHDVLVRAPRIGRLAAINDARARAIPGMATVVSGERLLRNLAQSAADTAPMQGVAEIFYVGQPIAFVAADSFDTACAASLEVRFDIEDTDPEPTAPRD